MKGSLGACMLAAALAAALAGSGRAQSPDSPAAASRASAAATTAPAIGAGSLAELRRVLAVYGIDPSFWHAFVDGQAWDDADNDRLWRLYFRLADVNTAPLMASRSQPAEAAIPSESSRPSHDLAPTDVVPWPKSAALAAASMEHKGELFSIVGQVRQVAPVALPAEAATLFLFDRCYRCELVLEGGESVTVFARHVPESWLTQLPSSGQAAARAFYLKFEGEPADPRPILAAERIAEFPDTLLGKLGMDVGLFDTVVDQKPLGPADQPAFYQLLSAVGRAAPDELREAARRQLDDAKAEFAGRKEEDLPRWVRVDEQGQWRYSVVPLFNDPVSQRGRLTSLNGVAKQVLKILIDEPALRAQLGFDHYYQIALFTEDSQDNPIIFCVREAPAGLSEGDLSKSPVLVSVAGFFFKSWAYPIDVPRGMGDGPPGPRMQLAPLLIGRQAFVTPQPAKSQNSTLMAVVITLIVAAVILLMLQSWRGRRGDRAFEKQFGPTATGGPRPDFAHWHGEPPTGESLPIEPPAEPSPPEREAGP